MHVSDILCCAADDMFRAVGDGVFFDRLCVRSDLVAPYASSRAIDADGRRLDCGAQGSF